MKIKYREASKELLRMASPQVLDEKKTRRSVNTSIDIIEHYNINIDKLISYDKQARKEFNEEELVSMQRDTFPSVAKRILPLIHSPDRNVM